MNNTNYNKNLIDLQDDTIEITNIIKTNNNNESIIEIHIQKSLVNSDKYCPHCGAVNIVTNSYHTRKIKYIKIGLFNSYLIYKQRRFKCRECNKTFNENCSLVNKNSTISNQVKTSILEEFKKKQSNKDIAERNNVSVTAANQAFIDTVLSNRKTLPDIVCIDEFKANTIAGKYALIIGNPRTGEIIDILPSRKQDYIYYYFLDISSEERFKVKYIVTDLFESYRTIVKNLFPKAIHIADRFHWIRLAVQAFDRLRINTMNTYFKKGKETKNKDLIDFYEITKKNHKILIANVHKKEIWYFDQQTKVPQLKKVMSYQEIIEYIINFDKSLEEGYHLLQDLYKMAKFTSYYEAEKEILNWCEKAKKLESKLPEFRTVVLTYKSWIKEISNSFLFDPITKSRITNGFIEGKNNFCKVIKRVGFGYKNFELFRAKVIHISNNLKDNNK